MANRITSIGDVIDLLDSKQVGFSVDESAALMTYLMRVGERLEALDDHDEAQALLAMRDGLAEARRELVTVSGCEPVAELIDALLEGAGNVRVVGAAQEIRRAYGRPT